ncbi:MAG: FHA domain-containing protein [Planctomycetota bacterium]|jgi:hypothetical protein
MVRSTCDFAIEYCGRLGGSGSQPGIHLDVGQRFEIRANPVLICRRPNWRELASGHVLLLDDVTISKEGHCRIWSDRGNLFIEDLGSHNGTFLSETAKLNKTTSRRIKQGQCLVLEPGMHFFAARCHFRVLSSAHEE